MAKLVDLSCGTVARITSSKEYSDSLTITVPAHMTDERDSCFIPAQSVTLFGKLVLLNLAKAIIEMFPEPDDEPTPGIVSVEELPF